MLDEILEKIKIDHPEIDENDTDKREMLIESIIISSGNKELKEKYLEFVEKNERDAIELTSKKSDKSRESCVQSLLLYFNLKKEVLERKIKVARSFLN